MEKTFREVIKDIKPGEVWEDIGNNDELLKIYIKNEKLHIENLKKVLSLSLSIDEAIFRKVK